MQEKHLKEVTSVSTEFQICSLLSIIDASINMHLTNMAMLYTSYASVSLRPPLISHAHISYENLQTCDTYTVNIN